MTQIIMLDAQPGLLAIDLAKTAVIVVDMQNDFGSKGGMFESRGIDVSGFQRSIAPIRNVLAAARSSGIKIVYLKMGFHPDLSNLGSLDAPNQTPHLRMGVGEKLGTPDGSEGRTLIRDTWNTDIVSELAPQSDDIVLYKHRFSGFYETELDSILKNIGIKYLIITGCTTSICVESTIRDAMFREYLCVLLKDCTSEPIGNDLPRSNHEASLLVIQTILGWVSDSNQFQKALLLKTIAAQPVGLIP